MNIGDTAQQSGLPTKTIRYYEEIGLITPARGANGYRDFSTEDVHKLRFIARGRALGFSVEDCRQLISLYEDQDRASESVKRIAQNHLAEIQTKMAELQAMQDTLTELVTQCAGDNRPDCPILKDLARAPLDETNP